MTYSKLPPPPTLKPKPRPLPFASGLLDVPSPPALELPPPPEPAGFELLPSPPLEPAGFELLPPPPPEPAEFELLPPPPLPPFYQEVPPPPPLPLEPFCIDDVPPPPLLKPRPKSISEGFQAYLSRLEPSTSEVEKRKSHRRSIEQTLAGEFRGFNQLLVIGSHTRQTAIHIRSDVDYFAKLGSDDVTWGGRRVSSRTTLERTKQALSARFSDTDVWIDGPAVVIGFGQGAGAVDVVPGVFVGTTATDPHYPVYEIADGEGGWRRTTPERHTKYLRDENERSGRMLSAVIRLLKAWKYARSPKIPIYGFHLELLLATTKMCVGRNSYQTCLLEAFRLIRDREGMALNDPLGITGRIDATATEAQRSTLFQHARYAAEKATSAIQEERAGNIDNAFFYWNLVFNQKFPSRS